jgi:ABC-type transport system substrate-binding protein
MAKAQEYLAKANITVDKSFTLTIDSDEESKAIADIAIAAWEKLGFTVELNVVEPKDSGTIIVDSGIQYLVKDASYGKIDYDVIAIDWQTYSLDAAAGLATLTSNLNGMGKDQFGGDVETGTPYYSVERKNIAGWSDSEYDKLVAAAIASTNKKERTTKLAEAERYLVSQMPVCPLVFNESFVFSGSKNSRLSS